MYKNKYRIESTRLKNWDYRWNGAYFVTICTFKKQCFFGEIHDNTMVLNDIGKWAQQFWQEIPNHFHHVTLDKYVVMPNHVHGIIILNNGTGNGDGNGDGRDVAMQRLYNNVNNNNPNNPDKNHFMSTISPKPGSLSTIIRSYKSAVTRQVRQINPAFEWQSRLHDHIIRDKQSFYKIKNYIHKNPEKWEHDTFNN